jgi:hypothetical protein
MPLLRPTESDRASPTSTVVAPAAARAGCLGIAKQPRRNPAPLEHNRAPTLIGALVFGYGGWVSIR